MNEPQLSALCDPLRAPEPRGAIRTRRVSINRATIVAQRALTHDTYELVVRCAADSAPLHAHAGQFATLRFPGIARPRPYSFARDPHSEAAGEHTFYIRMVPGGEVSSWLAGADRSGAEIEIAGPLGRFALDQRDAPMLCVAGGSGMSAIKAVLEHAARLRVARDCHFFYGARSQADLYAGEEIAAIAARWRPERRFEFTPVLSEEANGSSWSGARGFVTDYVQRAWLDRGMAGDQASAFFCGPPPMVAAGAAMLLKAGMPAAHIHRDEFEDARSPAPVIDNRRCVLCDECLLVKPLEHCIVETSGVEYASDGAVAAFNPITPAFSSGLYYNTLVIDADACIRCYACVDACPHDAIAPGYTTGNTLRQSAAD